MPVRLMKGIARVMSNHKYLGNVESTTYEVNVSYANAI